MGDLEKTAKSWFAFTLLNYDIDISIIVLLRSLADTTIECLL